jgi:hypothetical protein|tara:strand:+ start:237 stop:437 length:201 start_codon:yes stop_codon:yes gene_type:complete
MKVSITQYGTEHSIVTKTSIDYNDPNTLDDTDCDEICMALKQLLLSAGFQEDTIVKSIINLLENEE